MTYEEWLRRESWLTAATVAGALATAMGILFAAWWFLG